MDMGFELRFIEVISDYTDVDFTSILRVVGTEPSRAAMIEQEYISLKRLVEENLSKADFLAISRPQYAIHFRHRSDAMRIKLMWSPIQYKLISGPAW